jgi:hypothetical protein
MNKKITYLFLALALPALIFIFLKIFGKNHFEIPIYYKEGISDSLKECTGGYQGQYALQDSVFRYFNYKKGVACLFLDSSEVNHKEVTQLRQSYGEDQLQIISLVGAEPKRIHRIKNCVLFLKEPDRKSVV